MFGIAKGISLVLGFILACDYTLYTGESVFSSRESGHLATEARSSEISAPKKRLSQNSQKRQRQDYNNTARTPEALALLSFTNNLEDLFSAYCATYQSFFETRNVAIENTFGENILYRDFSSAYIFKLTKNCRARAPSAMLS